MADFGTHLLQADHNAELAHRLSTEPPFHDWAITAAFYASIHLFEAWLYDQPEAHTETSIPIDSKGKLLHSAHGWRQRLVQERLTGPAYRAFRKLREASETARYLTLFRMGTATPPAWIPTGAWEYFPQTAVRRLVQNDLSEVRRELRTDFACFIRSLNLEQRLGPAGKLAAKSVMDRYRDKGSLLATTRRELRNRFGPRAGDAIADGIDELGEKLAE